MKPKPKTPLTTGTLTVGAFDAKTNFSQLLDQVEEGKTIVITRHGHAVATLAPFQEPIDKERQERIEKAFAVFERISKGKSTDAATIKSMIEEGRRY